MAEQNLIETHTVRQTLEHIKTGAITSEELVQHHLDIIENTDAQIGAWAHLDKEHALQQAREADGIRKRGEPLGLLHGIPVGVKDIIDTVDFPTEYGSPIYKDRRPESDSRLVEKLKEAGAVIMGKTVTTEFAFMHPSATRNPHNPEFSPGGSSSGSAAAVAAGHVPLAIGSQTNGSVIRPAAFCGVYGYKPSAGIVSRRGVLHTSDTLDQLGVFGKNAGDVALAIDALGGYDRDDSASYLAPKPAILNGYTSEVPARPALAWIDMPYAGEYADDAAAGFEELLDALGDMVERIPAPQSFTALLKCHKIIHEYEIARCLDTEINEHWEQIQDTIKPILLGAREHTTESYEEAVEIRTAAIDWFRNFFLDYDAIVTPSALGEAPLMGSTGNPVCCTTWTLCGLPCINLPLLTGNNELPVGVQFVGALREDDRLLRTTRYVIEQLYSTVNAGAEVEHDSAAGS